MKLTRAQFLKALPAAVLALAGCTAAPTAPADTDELVFDHAYPLDATQFTADCYADGSTLLTIPDAQAKFLVRPEGAATLRTVPEGVTVLQQPLQNLYLVSTSVMDLFLALDALDCIALSGKVITAEEHNVIGGLGEAVCAVLSEKLPTPVRRVGVQDVFGCSGPAWDLLAKYGLDAATICKTAHEMLNK